ncbi:hypothetical protein M011DRAFT_462343 [Sporormia fimetaria CBS 119925]|uniref:Tcp11-domain-containing protein n=1 Tax=Sporormia fimetaria CBS 119925 TaxID=1340428 RepID=A0A6A6UXR9_9PLEO|nr:hypothetical protein M011DRAFT_462343 [Sporormia fimetaria CBS 119925]
MSSDRAHSAPPATHDEIPEEDAMLLSDDAANSLPVEPPPRIAARFRRPSTTRRKSSAASSRRNSFSSQHSHQSNRSLRNSCQSHHVAQHLRRTSILETRKARLADRAVHAEQVRLRAAALAKAPSRSSNSEERALAAQQARERHLAQVAAACAEEVRKAKKVAEAMKEKKAAEERRYRLEMEEKHAEAERRRQEYKRNTRRPRTGSSPTTDSPKKPVRQPLSQDAAARRIQAAWRARRRRRIVEAWSELGLSIDKVHDSSFEDITVLLKDDKVEETTGQIMSLLNLLSGEEDASRRQAVRTFLAAYLILGHPAHIFTRDGDQEQDLITKAKDLIISFESALSKLTASNYYTPSPTWLETVSMTYGPYVSAFNDWKALDSSALIETMIASFVNLDAIWQTIKDGDTVDEVANEYRNGIRDNQAILLSKIKKLAGPERALVLIRKAIRESRRARPKKKPSGENARPRVAIDTPAAASAMAEENAARQTQTATSQLAAPESPRSDASQQATSLAKLFTNVPDNRELVHELSIDSEFRIDPSPTADLRDALYRELCSGMLEAFETGDSATWTVAMAELIRAKLLHLLKPGNSLYSLIEETVDPELINNQCRQGAFSYDKFFEFMASILPKLCAPFRDAEVKALADELQTEGDLPEMIEKVFKLLHIIDLLSLDYSNFLLSTAAPTLIQEAPGYEQRMFAHDLESGRLTLKRTRRWWRSAAVNMHTEADRRDPWNNEASPINRPTPQKIYARGLVDLAIATPPLRESELPETLRLDYDRLSRMRAEALRIVTIGGILLTAKNLLKRDVRSQWRPEANRLWETLKDGFLNDPTNPSKVLSLIESAHPMPPSTRAQLQATITRLLTQAESGRVSDPVTKVLFQRLKTNVFNRVSASSSGERVRAASTATEGLATTGLPEFVGQVGDMVDLLGKISVVDRSAHGKWYEEIAEEMERLSTDGEELSRTPSAGSSTTE